MDSKAVWLTVELVGGGIGQSEYATSHVGSYTSTWPTMAQVRFEAGWSARKVAPPLEFAAATAALESTTVVRASGVTASAVSEQFPPVAVNSACAEPFVTTTKRSACAELEYTKNHEAAPPAVAFSGVGGTLTTAGAEEAHVTEQLEAPKASWISDWVRTPGVFVARAIAAMALQLPPG